MNSRMSAPSKFGMVNIAGSSINGHKGEFPQLQFEMSICATMSWRAKISPHQRRICNIVNRTTLPLQQSPILNSITTTHAVMESLLSLSFDYLSSNDGIKIRKGLRQLESLLAQICLSRSPSASAAAADRRHSVIGNGASNGSPKQATKELSSLKDDPAFREFFKLQEGFEWNGTSSNAHHHI